MSARTGILDMVVWQLLRRGHGPSPAPPAPRRGPSPAIVVRSDCVRAAWLTAPRRRRVLTDVGSRRLTHRFRLRSTTGGPSAFRTVALGVAAPSADALFLGGVSLTRNLLRPPAGEVRWGRAINSYLPVAVRPSPVTRARRTGPPPPHLLRHPSESFAVSLHAVVVCSSGAVRFSIARGKRAAPPRTIASRTCERPWRVVVLLLDQTTARGVS